MSGGLGAHSKEPQKEMTMRHNKLALILAVLSGAWVTPAFPYTAVPIGTFATPVDIRVGPGRPGHLYVVEKPGRIVLLRHEVATAKPFLDISSLVIDAGERGLLSLAFPADYDTSRRFYVLFVNKLGNVEIDEFRRSSSNDLIADFSSRRIILVVPHAGASNHNGGQLSFSSDGLLFISIGDGGTGGDAALNLESLLGKLLRINPLPAGTSAYQIPPGNPYVGRGGRDEIYAYGLRNPWRAAVQGNIISIGDVGQAQQEEVDMLTITGAKGVNFGWPEYEGNRLNDPTRPGPDAPTFPIFTYAHTGGRCAIMGGYLVRDQGLPALRGRYLYGDLCTGEIRSFIPHVGIQAAAGDAPLGVTILGLNTFGTGIGGQTYIAGGNTLYRLEP